MRRIFYFDIVININMEVYMYIVYFICVIVSIIIVVFMYFFEEEDIFFCIYMFVIVRLKKVNSLNVLLSFVIIIFIYW